ncbi:MAG: hypothetical protein AB1782_05215 [Cyanobacteriota bacterium]
MNTSLKPMIVNFSPDQAKAEPKKSHFYQINKGFYINPDHIALITHGKKSNSTVLYSNDRSKMLTLTNAVPGEVVKVLDLMV